MQDAEQDADTTDLEQVWRQSINELQARLPATVRRAWLSGTKPVSLSHDTLVLAAPHSFAREQLQHRYESDLAQAAGNAAGRAVKVVVTVQEEAADAHQAVATDPTSSANHRPRYTAQAPITSPPPAEALTHLEPVGKTASDSSSDSSPPPEQFARPSPGLHQQLNESYTFDRFVVGSSNRFPYAAAFAVSEAPASAYNPLFIYGGAGLGKTHLLHAVGHYTTGLDPSRTCRYVTTEQFTNEFIEAVTHGSQSSFMRRYRDVDVLLIDDIQFLAGKERTQEEFFHTFNALQNKHKQLVISSDRPPKQIGSIEERLRTRFECGLLTDIQPPDLETRLAILRKKSEQEALEVPNEVLELIASRISSNVRELEGALIRVTAFASLQHTEVSLQLAQLVLKDLFPDTGHSETNVGLVMSETASYFEFTLDELCSTSRTRQLVTARQIAMYLTRELTELSLPKIGQAFGKRDHTTVMHATKKIAELMQERPTIYQQVQELTSRIKAATG
jgi:chromosomal replication initiator protein